MTLANPLETGKLGIVYLKRIWSYYLSKPDSSNHEALDWGYTNSVFNVLGIGLEPTIRYLFSATPTFSEFEDWVLKNGQVSDEMIRHFNSLVIKDSNTDISVEVEEEAHVLTEKDLEDFDNNGYIILKNAIPKEDCEEAASVIYKFLGADPNQPETWYDYHPLRQGIMVQLFNQDILN